MNKKEENNMAPGPITRNYALAETVEELEVKVDKMADSIVILISVIEALTCKVYGSRNPGGKTPMEILAAAEKMTDSWVD
jgi:hypothetical protein